MANYNRMYGTYAPKLREAIDFSKQMISDAQVSGDKRAEDHWTETKFYQISLIKRIQQSELQEF